MNRKNVVILFLVALSVVSILGFKFCTNNNKSETIKPQVAIEQALQKQQPMWLLFRSQT